MTIPLFQPHHYHPENVLLVTTTTSSSTGSKSSSIITTPSSLSSALTTNKKVAGVPFPPRHPQHPQLAEASFLVENYHIDDFATARDSCCSSPEYGSDDDSDEDASVETLSTACSDETNSATTNDSNSSNSSSNSRSVSFCSELVTDVWTRPFTNEEDLSELFYSSLETQRFREEYRWERRRKGGGFLHSSSDCCTDDASSPDEDAPVPTGELGEGVDTTAPAVSYRKVISRVMIWHEDDNNNTISTLLSSSSSVSLLGPKDEHTASVVALNDRDDMFDTPEFWSGSITWW